MPMTQPPAAVVWDERFLDYDFGPGHPFSERSRMLAVRLLGELSPRDRVGPVGWVDAIEPATRELLETFHHPEYLEFVERVGASRHPTLLDGGDTPGFVGCYDAAARLVSGADRALALAVERSAPAFHPAGGLHHAHPDRASGFCIFNDVAIAVARAARGHSRVAYIDIDAHHGDGVMYNFYRSGRILDIDFHQDGRTLFPGTGFADETGRADGAGLKVNVPLPPGAGDEALLPLFHRIVPPLVRDFRPEVIVLQHGVDGHVGDALAQLQYTPRAYAEIDRTVLGLAREVAHARLVVTGGGGYRPESVSRVLARTGAILAGLEPPPDAEVLPDRWRDDFHWRTGVEPPLHWGDAPSLSRTPWTHDDEDGLVRELESGLGRRFPADR